MEDSHWLHFDPHSVRGAGKLIGSIPERKSVRFRQSAVSREFLFNGAALITEQLATYSFRVSRLATHSPEARASTVFRGGRSLRAVRARAAAPERE